MVVKKYSFFRILFQIKVGNDGENGNKIERRKDNWKRGQTAYSSVLFAGILLIARSERAVMVKEGFTPGLEEIIDPSQINIL